MCDRADKLAVLNNRASAHPLYLSLIHIYPAIFGSAYKSLFYHFISYEAVCQGNHSAKRQNTKKFGIRLVNRHLILYNN